MKTPRGWLDRVSKSATILNFVHVLKYERLGKSVILGGKKSQKADMRFVAVKKLRKVLVLLFIHILGQCINTVKSDAKF